MSLFGKKREEKEAPLQFPELPKSVPSFEPFGNDVDAIRSAVSPSPSLSMRPMLPSSLGDTEKPLFVKIEKYRDVVETLKKLKTRLNEADTILSKLNRLKEEEDRELSMWQSDLEKIRNQLLEIDKKLFD